MNFNYGVPGDSVTVSVFDQGGQCANYQSIFCLWNAHRLASVSSSRWTPCTGGSKLIYYH